MKRGAVDERSKEKELGGRRDFIIFFVFQPYDLKSVKVHDLDGSIASISNLVLSLRLEKRERPKVLNKDGQLWFIIKVRLPDYVGSPDDRIHISPSSVTFPIPFIGRKSLWETRDKAAKISGNQDPMAWKDYGPSHELARPPIFRELFDRTHKRKGTDDYVSESARAIVETYDRTIAERYVEGTPQPDLDPEAWVDAAGGSRKGQVYNFGDSLDTTPVLSSCASLVAPSAYASSSVVTPRSSGKDIRSLISEELS
ncbi:hypothetical protein Taro_024788 [Colocasia esculenta]|uniref:Uncharacterized protein n=1 Tax=Colocasia esculenta TaxID=4460 RepID=A0A843V7Q0_COLES|nr:hypothetical protein [Colocasia esculenta]